MGIGLTWHHKEDIHVRGTHMYMSRMYLPTCGVTNKESLVKRRDEKIEYM